MDATISQLKAVITEQSRQLQAHSYQLDEHTNEISTVRAWQLVRTCVLNDVQ